MASLTALTDPSLTIIFETSPLGLGHLRVTDALYHGLPKDVSPVLLGAQAPKSSAIYRFASTHMSTRKILEMMQLPPLDQPVAAIGRQILRRQTNYVYEHVKNILSERFTIPQTVLLVATHAIHAHPLGAIKERLSRELGIRILLIVQVTDASPQAIWYVTDADMIFVPSAYTKKKLEAYGSRARLPHVPIAVTAYPVSPILTEEVSAYHFDAREQQVDASSASVVHMSVPISGAAVGTDFTETFIRKMHQLSHRFVFHIVAREAGYTQKFIQTMVEQPYVRLSVSTNERVTVDNYEIVFKETNISLELTKPSEQAFKVLATPHQRGGAIMLFSRPVGGQEYDNVRFLHTHGLVPTQSESESMWTLATNGEHLHDKEVLARAKGWRGVLLPENAEDAAVFTQWCLENGIFTKMMQYEQPQVGVEVRSNGVEQFWREVKNLLQQPSKRA